MRANRTLVETPAFDPIELYADAIDTSNYVEQVAPLVREHVAPVGDLLDVGAGGGQLGAALREPTHLWTAVEPAKRMRLRLARQQGPLQVIPTNWAAAKVGSRSHDTVLAANMPAPLRQPEEFLIRCQDWARRVIVWVVPAQHGPRGLVFAGCLPAVWHGEDETPGIEIVLRKLAPRFHPPTIEFAEWTFSAYVPDLQKLASYLAHRLGWPSDDPRRFALADHLAKQAKHDDLGVRLEIPRRSAILVWRLNKPTNK